MSEDRCPCNHDTREHHDGGCKHQIVCGCEKSHNELLKDREKWLNIEYPLPSIPTRDTFEPPWYASAILVGILSLFAIELILIGSIQEDIKKYFPGSQNGFLALAIFTAIGGVVMQQYGSYQSKRRLVTRVRGHEERLRQLEQLVSDHEQWYRRVL